MTKFLLPILLCLAYLSTSAIILTPVTFADEPTVTEPSGPIDTLFPPVDNTQTETTTGGIIVPDEVTQEG